MSKEPCVGVDGPCRETLQLMPDGTEAIMYFLFVVSLVVFGAGVWMHVDAWRRGRKEPEARENAGGRFRRFLRVGVFQAKNMKKRYAGPMHQLIYWGFIVLFIGTVLVLVEYDFTLPLFNYQFLVGNFYLVFEFVLDVAGILFLVGVAMAAKRRLSGTKEAFVRNPWVDTWVLGSLALLGVQGFLLEGLRLAIRDPAWAGFSFAGNLIAVPFQGLGGATQLQLYQFMWWFHAVTLFAWIAALPYTKMRHILTSPAQVYLARTDNALHRGELTTPFNLQKALETGDLDITMGAQKLEDFTWRELLMLDACTECGRCTDACPANAAGRPLSPMHVVLNLRDEMHRRTADRWTADITGLGEPQPGHPAYEEPAGNGTATGNQLVNDVVRDTTLWSCVTCRACMEECPVNIEHVPLIVDMRRGLVMESRLDGNQTRLLNNLANTGNAYGFPASDRDAWAEGLDVPRMADVENPGDLEVLYWVGCSGSYDSRNQKVSRALVKVLKAANVKFAILGNEEKCNGDPARRLGEESRYQELVIQNAETFKKYGVTKVIAQCPHCFNTLQNEYRRFGAELEVEHHTQFIDRLLKEGRLKPAKKVDRAMTYHDPCYLGRYNQEYDAPRAALNLIQLGGEVKEMHRHKNKSFCCGAGGSNMWFEVKEERERMSNIRMKEALATGTKTMATACPFCMTMFDDANRMVGDEENFQVKDFAEIVADSLDA